MKLFFTVILVLAALTTASPYVDAAAPDLTPELQIKIGGWGSKTDFKVGYGPQSCPTEQSQSGQCLQVPWIGQYVGVIYRYGLAMAAVLAVLMIMIGGVLWLTSAGSPERVSTAKSFITAAISGLTLALLSFVILYTVNPALVALKPIVVAQVSDMPEVYGGQTAEYVGGSGYHCLTGNVCGSVGLTKEACELVGGQIVGNANYDQLCDASRSCACYEFSGSGPGKLVSCAAARREAEPIRCQESNAPNTNCFEVPVRCPDVSRQMTVDIGL